MCTVARVLTPWTQSVTFGWRADLRFLEKRLELLRHLEEERAMWAFRTADERIDARLVDQWQQLSIHQTGVTMHLLSPEADAEHLWEATKYAVDQVQPRHPMNIEAGFQYLVPLDVAFEPTVRDGAAILAHGFGLRSETVADWALLLDLDFDGAPQVLGQTEFGVVTAQEVPDRLMRRHGRVQAAVSPGLPANLWAGERFPEVALFAEFALRSGSVSASSTINDVRVFWDVARSHADTLVNALQAKFAGSDNKEEVAS